jgi:AraC-like DNA-binding protein
MDKTPEKYQVPHFSETILRLICGDNILCGPKWSSKSKLHSDDFNRLYCLLDGSAVIDGKNGRVQLEPGFIYLIPGQYNFLYDCPVSMQLLWVHFQLEFLPGLDVFQRFTPKPFYPANHTEIEDFKYLISQLNTASPKAFMEGRVILLCLLQKFMPDDWNTIQPDPENVERLKPALELLNSRYNRPFDLKKTAKAVNMHPAYMSELFRRTFGASPSRYVMDLRMRRAQTLLLTTDRRISDIAAECGFDDPLYFSRAFRKRCRFSPREFRQRRGI